MKAPARTRGKNALHAPGVNEKFPDHVSALKVPLTNTLRFPHLPHLAYQIGAGCKGGFSGLPTGRCHLSGFNDMLECLNLPEQFVRISSNFRSQYFHGPDHKVWINDETPPDIHSSCFIVDSIDGTDFSSAIRKHGKRNSSVNHLGEFFFLPDFMNKAAVCA